MADAVRNPLVNIDPRYFLTGDVVERPPAERPKHDTIEGIMDWLAGPAQHNPLLVREFDEYAWRMLAAGFPLLRATLQLRTLHPQYLGATFVWWRTTGQTVQTFIAHEVQDLFGDEDNPVRRVLVAGETVRRRVDVADEDRSEGRAVAEAKYQPRFENPCSGSLLAARSECSRSTCLRLF
jgi:hypothetical protein